MKHRIGILGGTFDPVHNAHLAIAGAGLRALDLEKVLWIPTGVPPYRAAPAGAAPHRLAMLRLALAGEPRYSIDERELKPGTNGYTYDTLVSLGKDYPQAEFILIIGADQYAKLDSWYRHRDLPGICRLAVAARPASPQPQGDIIPLALPEIAISASDIRARIGRGEDVSALLPGPVLDYIGKHHLYGHP